MQCQEHRICTLTMLSWLSDDGRVDLPCNRLKKGRCGEPEDIIMPQHTVMSRLLSEHDLGGLSDRPVSVQPNRANAVDITELCRGESKA